jgi:TonB family protein
MRKLCRIKIAFTGIALSLCALLASAQSAKDPEQVPEEAVISKLSPPIYPPLARQTRISGDVVLKLEVQPNGTVASAVVVSGHPLLSPFALESAQKSQFVCKDCGEVVHSYRLIYTFELTASNGCADQDEKSKVGQEQSYPRVTQAQGRVIVSDRPAIISDPAITYTRVRSIKCLYLLKCAFPRVAVFE